MHQPIAGTKVSISTLRKTNRTSKPTPDAGPSRLAKSEDPLTQADGEGMQGLPDPTHSSIPHKLLSPINVLTQQKFPPNIIKEKSKIDQGQKIGPLIPHTGTLPKCGKSSPKDNLRANPFISQENNPSVIGNLQSPSSMDFTANVTSINSTPTNNNTILSNLA